MKLLYRRLSWAAMLAVPLLWMLKRAFIPYLWQDFRFSYLVFRYLETLEKQLRRCPSFSVLDIFLKQVATRPDQTFIVYQDESYTYKEIDAKSNQAAWALRHHAKLKKGDCVAIFMNNKPAYIWIWLALAKLGCSMACLNYNIRAKSFLHCFNSSGAKALIVAPEIRDAVEEVLPALQEKRVMIFYLTEEPITEDTHSLLDKVEAASQEPIPRAFASDLMMDSPALYIYTSGTTGFPKAVMVPHKRVLVSSAMTTLSGMTHKDVIYITLPLYHSSGLLIGVRGCIQQGATCVLRSKFSVSQFWEDCRKYNVTVFLYIGEILRYLLNTPPKSNDKDHCVRIAIGNGLRADVWREFIARFGPIQINEFYASTESNPLLFNIYGKIGAVGRWNPFIKARRPFELIKFDVETEEPARDQSGCCIRVPRGETGLLVVKNTTTHSFCGYMGNDSETEKKRLRDVFEKGDVYFNTGDLLMVDHEGFVYFQDRVGDTFRWKGENVATTEVADVVVSADFIEEANVYGVQVPYHEGRIGMAAIKLKQGHGFDGEKLYAQVVEFLPNYARPRFVRIQDTIDITGTFKQQLRDAVEEVLPTLAEDGVMVFYLSHHSPTEGVHSLLDKIEAASKETIPKSFTSHLTKTTPALYIYTSGTTGLPKAAIINQGRLLISSALTTLSGMTCKDILYIPLPLYHSAGLIIGVRGCIQQGATCVIKNKFSASQFWDDCRKYNVTAFQYIGEILRYLCNTPKKDNDKDHNVRIALGNGLRSDVWKEFINRFGPIQIKEFYAATEGNSFIFNYTGKIGAAGRCNSLLRGRRPLELIKYDVEKDEPVRDASGHCIRIPAGDVGLLVSKITPTTPFYGYAGDQSLTEKKRLRDVLEDGDLYFNTGDLFIMDRDGFMYFQDRVGDTFRWKGENVATTEVADILGMTDFIEEANVYGVPIPYHEGRIGMAAIKLKKGHSFDGKKLHAQMVEYLPNYARPYFVRIQDSIEVTGTFKQCKVKLIKEGFNPLTINDPLYFLDDTDKRYTPMTQEIYNAILANKRKL